MRRCLEKDRELRFQSARDLAFNLETAVDDVVLEHAPECRARSDDRLSPGAESGAHGQRAARGRNGRTTGDHIGRSGDDRGFFADDPPTGASAARSRSAASRRCCSALLFVVSIAGAAYGGWIWAQRAEGPVAEPAFQRLTFRRGEVRGARFSPDGETIVYSAAWDGTAARDFRRQPACHGGARPRRARQLTCWRVSKSAELAILLRRDRQTNLGTLARVPLAGGTPREVAENVMQADWSPDGAKLAIIRQQRHQDARRVSRSAR